MSSDYSRDDLVERGSIPLDIDNVHMLLQVEQEQIQKKTFTNWVNAQLAKRRPPCMVVDLFNDFRDGSKLLDLLEVMSGQRISRERGRGMFQHRSNIEKALLFLKNKSIKLVNINIPDIIDGKPSIILGLIWTIILQYHIEELASGLSFSSRQSSMESLASLDSRSTLSSRSASSSPVPPRGSPLHNRFKVSAKKALLLWVREQCHKAGCSINVKDFKVSWRSGVVFLAIQYALRPDLVDLSKARTRSNKQNLEEAFRIAEKELRIPRLLDPDDVDVRDPDEKSIMTYVAQFLQYSKDLPVPEEEMQTQYLTLPKSPSPVNLPVHYTPAISASPLRQATPERKAQEVTCWLLQAYNELLEGWDSTEGESYSERYHVFQTFLVSFNEQRRPIMPLLTAMRRNPKLSEEQRALREAWDTLTEKLREYKVELDMSLPSPLDMVARWLLKTEKALAEEEGDPQDHGRAADEAREKQELLKVCLEEMPQHVRTFQSFQNLDEYGNMMVPADKIDELKRRFTSVRVTAKYHGIKLDYREQRHTVLDLLGQIRTKLRVWRRPYISPEAVRVLLHECHDLVNTQELPSLLEAALHKLKHVSEKYSSKSALSADYHSVSQQVKQLEEDTAVVLGEVKTAKNTMAQVLSIWDSYSDSLSSLQAWLEQGSATHSYDHAAEVTSESMAEWGSRQAHLNEMGNFLIESTDPQTSRSLAEELRCLNMRWAEFFKRNALDGMAEPSADIQARPQDIQALIREATLILKEPLEAMAGPLRTYRKRIQFIMRKIKEVDLEALAASTECPADQLQKLKLAIPEVVQTLFEAEQVCAELQHSVSGLDSRLAELLHWEADARELYQLLRAAERQQQRVQDPRARVLISRGLQLEGQVVTEEQDLQVVVNKSQKNSPIQYLHASAMRDRVQAAVAQSQEVVGMLSSLGARRERSPPEGSPPSKVFKQAKAQSQDLTQSDTIRWPTQQPEAKLAESHGTFVPNIVVQEYREENVTSPPLPYTYAQAVMQTRTMSPPEVHVQVGPETAAQKQQQTQEHTLMLQKEQLNRATEKELQQQPQELHLQGLIQAEPLQRQEEKEQVGQQQVEMHQYQVQQQVVTQRQAPEQTSLQQPPVKKQLLSSQEIQSRRTQAMKNRPWLQKPASEELATPERDSTQEPIKTRQSDRETVGSVQVVSQHTPTARPQLEEYAKVTKEPQQKKQKQAQPQKLQQQQPPQQVKKQQKQQEQLLQQQQQQEKQPQPIITQTQPDSDTKTQSQIITMPQPHPQPNAQNQSQSQTMVQSKSQVQVHVQSTSVSTTTTDTEQPLKTMSQTRVSQDQSQTQVLPQPHGSIKAQSLTQPHVHTQPQTGVTAKPQPLIEPQHRGLGPAIAQVQTWAQVRPSSPMQAPLHSQFQPPVPSHFQLRSHPLSWAPVRPPSPKPPTDGHIQTHGQSMAQSPINPQSMAQSHTPPQSTAQSPIHPQSMPQPQIHLQSTPQTQIHAQSMAHPQFHAQSMAHPQSHAQSMAHPQSPAQSMAHPQSHAQSMAHPQSHVQSMAHPHSHAQSMAHPQTHPQSIAHPQTYPQSMTHSHTHAQSMIQDQTHTQSVVQTQTRAQPLSQPSHAQPSTQAQLQIHAWPQVRVASPMSAQHPQATAQHPFYPQGYPQVQTPPQQWTHKQEPEKQGIAQQRHPIPEPYPQQTGQAPQSQVYPKVQAALQWSQAGPQQVPQVGPSGYSHMGPSYTQQTQTQHWAQTQPQMRPQISMQQQPQMSAFNMFHIQTQQDQRQQQAWVQVPHQLQPQPYPQPQSQHYSQVHHQHQIQRHSQPQMQTQIPPQSQPPHQAQPQPPSQPQLQPQLQAQSQTHIHTQSLVQVKTQAQTQQPQLNLQFQQPAAQPKHQAQLQPQLKIQSPTQPKGDSAPQPKPLAQLSPQIQSPTHPKADWSSTVPQALPQPQMPPQPMALIKTAESPPKPKPQAQTAPLLEAQSVTQPKVQSPARPKAQSSSSQIQTAPPPKAQSPVQPKTQSLPQTKLQTQLPPQPQLQAQSPPLPQAQTLPQSKAQLPPQARPQTQPETQSPPQPKPQQPQTIPLSQANVLPQSLAESPDLCIKHPALAQAPPQAYTEAYVKAQALARNGFEEAKHCLQEHIVETINIFKDKSISAEQASVKEESLKTMDPELLDEFLRAAKGMEAFCTPLQLRDMEYFTQSVRSQWQACFSAEGSFAEAGQHLEALKELCDTLSPEDAHRLAQTQLRECETRLAAIQRQFSGDQDALLPDSRIPAAFSEDLSTPKEATRPTDKTETFQVTVNAVGVGKREIEKQTSVEDEATKKEASERYENCKKSLQAQLAKNEQSIKEVPSDSVSLKGLHTRLQEIQFLRQETESLWSEYANQCSQLNGNPPLEQEKAELQEQWRHQQSKLQRRGSSLGDALRQIDSTENHMVDFTDRLDRYLRQPKDITAFTPANTNILKDIKELDDNIQSELDQLSRLDPESSDLDPRDCFPLSREVQTHRSSLDQLRQQVRKSEAAARALDRFLMSLRTVDEDISGVQGAPCCDTVVLQDCRSKLGLIRQSIDSLKEKAPQLDVLLQGARLTVTRDGVPASCLDMVAVLLRRLEEADSGLASQQKGLQKETQSKSIGLRKRALLGELRKLQETIEAQGLKEPTIPAVQHRLRALSDLEGQMQALHAELQNLQELQEKQGGGENLLQELETQWKETQRAFSDRKKQCSILLELLKKFQSCRSHLSNTMQKAEQAISDHASYLCKDNLQRSIIKVGDAKEGLGSVREHMEEMRTICRQLQSQLKKFPDCSEPPFEAEADTLMDNWLDLTEKTDTYLDNLQVALELWEKQLMLGGEVDSWAGAKLALFAESHPFHNKQQVLSMRDEIHANEENIDHFHKKSVEMQEMLQSQEAPLELQVMETQLRKRMEQVKELFADCTDVFEELMAVQKHLTEKVEECQSAVESIQCAVSNVDASHSKVEEQIQHLCDDLEAQEQQAEAVLKEVGFVSSVASPQVLETLSADCSRLREAISRTKDMVHLKREERDKGLLKVIEDERQSFEEWFQDLQLSVNECFEHPESRTDVETSLQRLSGFLKSRDAERRLEQLSALLERGSSQQLPPQQLSELTEWLKEQQKEVGRFRTHCLTRQKQMEPLLADLNSLQKQHYSFSEWLQNKEKQSVESDNVKLLLQDLQDESGRAEALSELLASVRRQGVRAESLLKDADNLIQRYRNLEVRLQRQADDQQALEGEFDKFNIQAKSTRTWIHDLVQPLTSPGRDIQTEEVKHKAQAILSSKPEGDSKVDNLRRQSQSLCEQEDLEKSLKEEVQQSLRETEEQWRRALQTAEENLCKAETQALLDKDLEAVKTQNESVQSWIRDQEQSLQSLGGSMQVEEKLQIIHATLSSKPDGDSKLQDLKHQCQGVCDSQGLEESRRQEVQDAVRQTEEQWRKVLQTAEEGLKQAESEAAAARDLDAFKAQSKSIQSWMKEQKQKLLSLGSHMQFEERLQVAQAVMTSKPEGESKVLQLKTHCESLTESLDESRKAEVEQLVKDTEQQWRAVLQAAGQAELRSLSDDFDSQSSNTQSWIRERQQKLQSVGSHTPPEERHHTAQTILSSKPEGDCAVNNLRRRGQSLCDHQDVDQGRKVQVQETIRDTEEQWKTVLQAAKQVEAAAGAEISQRTERRVLELREFDTQHQDTVSWLTDLQQRLDSLKSQSKAEDRLHTAQAIMSSKPEGDLKLQELKRQCQSLCSEDLKDLKKLELQEKIRGTEEQWVRVLQDAKQTVEQAERECALEDQLKDYEVLRATTRAWLQNHQQRLMSLGGQTDPEETINTAQSILGCKPEGDSKLTELRRQSQSLSEHEATEAQQTVKDSEEQWRMILQTAEDTLKKAEIHYSLSRELEAFRSKAGSTKTWVKKLQQQAKSKGSGTEGSRAQIEDRLNTAQAILRSKSKGEAQVMELKRRAQSLCEQKELQEDKKLDVQQTVEDTEQEWRTVLQNAEETQRQLKSVVERLASWQHQRNQTEARLSEFQKQTNNLPRVFPWPGLGERRQAVDQARVLLDQSTALVPVLSALRTQAAELFEITKDPNWSDPSWAAKEASIPALLKELTETIANLEQGILTERQCTQLVEQHEAAQDWLREHVKGLGAPPADREGLHSAVNTLKALLQTVDREQREMKELDAARDSLLNLCTPGGRDALTLEVSHLHDLCATSEQEVRMCLTACEMQLEELDCQLARRAQGLRERAAALQWELRSLDQALSYSEPQDNITQLQQHWHSLQNCEKSLKSLGVKVHDLHQEVESTPATDDLPTEIMTVVKSLCQQHDSLKSRLGEHQSTCSTNTARYLMDCLHALQEWNQSKLSESISSVQVTLEDGEKLQTNLREVLSHQQFLTDCLMPVMTEKLERDASETLREADTHKAALTQSLKELDGKSKQKLPDALHGDVEETKTSVVAPPRKSKRSPEKKHQLKLQTSIPLTEKSTSGSDELQTETKTSKPTVTAVMDDWCHREITGVEQTRIGPTEKKSGSPTDASEPFTAPHLSNTSQEDLFKSTKLDTRVHSVGAEQITPAPVPSRRKANTSSTDTESAQTQMEPEMVKTIITQVSSGNPIGTAPVEEIKHIKTIILDVTEPFTSTPATTSSAGELTTKTVTEQAETTVESKNTDISLKVTILTPLTETSAEQPKPLQKEQESKSSGGSTTPEPVTTQSIANECHSELVETKIEPKNAKTFSMAEGITQQVKTAILGESKLSPTKRKPKSPNLSPEGFSTMQTMDRSDSQIPLLSSKEQTEAIVVDEENKVIPIRKKSKSLDISTVSEPPSTAERLTEAAVLEHSEVSPRKQRSTTLPVKQADQQTTLTATLQQDVAHNITIDVEPDDKKKEPDSLKSSSTPQFATEPTKTAVMKENKLSPTKRRSKGSNLSPEHVTKEVTETRQESESQKATLSFDKQTVDVDEIKVMPTKSISKGLEVSTVPEPLSPLGRIIGVEPREIKQKPQNDPATPEFASKTATVEQSKLLPPKRKSKTVPPVELADNETPQTKKEPAGQKSSLTSNDQNIVVDEEIRIVPTRKKSKNDDFSKTSLVTHVRSPECETEQNMKEPDSQKSTSDVVRGSTTVEHGKVSPTQTKMKGLKLSPDLAATQLAKTKEQPDSEKPSSTQEMVTATTEITVADKGDLSPSKGKSKGLKEPHSQKPSSPQKVVITPMEITNIEKGELPLTKEKGLKLSTEFAATKALTQDKHILIGSIDGECNVAKEETKSGEASDGQVVSGAIETTVVKDSKLSSPKRKSKSVDVFLELSSKEPTQNKEEPDKQEYSSSSRKDIKTVVSGTSQIVHTEKTTKPFECSGIAMAPRTIPIVENVLQQIQAPQTNMQNIDTVSEKQPSVNDNVKTSVPQRVKPVEESQTIFKNGCPISEKSENLIQEVEGIKVPTVILDTSVQSSEKVDTCILSPNAEPDLTHISTVAELTHDELQEPKDRSEEASEQAITKSTERGPSASASEIANYIDKLWENTSEIQKRYMILDLPDIGITQMSEIMPDGSVADSVSIEPSTVVYGAPLPQMSETDFSEISLTEQDIKKPSESMSQLKLTQIRSKEDKDYEGLALSTECTTTELRSTKEEPYRQKPSSTPELVTATSKITVVEKRELLTVKGRSKGFALSTECAPTELKKTAEEYSLGGSTDVEYKKAKEETKTRKDLTGQIRTGGVEMDVVKDKKFSPGNRNSKGQILNLEVASTELTKTKDEPYSQKPFAAPTNITVVEKGQHPPIKRKSEDLKGSPELDTMAMEDYDSQKLSSTPEVVTETTESTTGAIVEEGQFSPTKRKSKDLKLSSEVSTTELTKTKNESDSQMPSSTPISTEMTVVENVEIPLTKGTSKSLILSPECFPKEMTKAMEDSDSQQLSSTPEAPTETTVAIVEAGQLSPTKRNSTDLKLSPEISTTELTKVKDEFVSQVPSSIPGVVTVTSGISVVNKGKLSPASTGLKISPEIATTELTQTKEDPDSQKSTLIPEVLTTIPEINVMKEGEFSPTQIKVKGLKLSSDLPITELTKTKEGPHSQKSFSTPEYIVLLTANVEKGELSPTKRKLKSLKHFSESTTTEVMDVEKEPDSEMSSVDFREQTQAAVLGELAVPVRKMILDVTTAAEPVSALGGSFDVEAKGESENGKTSTAQKQVYKAEKIPSLQAVQECPTDFILDDKAQAEASVVETEKLVLEEPERSVMKNIFTEIQLLSGAGFSSQLIKGKPCEDAAEALTTSTSDLDNRLSRLVSKALSCKNYPAELNPTAMDQQLKEAQECRATAQAQVSFLSQLRGADAENRDALDHMVDQWSAAVQDADAVIQSKQAQLQLVNDYCRQTQAVKSTLERLTAELDAVKMTPEESSVKESERLYALLRSMEENRTVVGELLMIYTMLCPNLSWSEQATAQTEQRALQEKWRGLERAVERALYHTNVYSRETSSLLSAISDLQEHLETISKDLEAKSPSVTEWNCKKAQQLMVANAEVKAAQKKYLHLQQLSEVLLLSSQRVNDTTEIQQGLQTLKDQLCHTEELVSSQTQTSSNSIMEKIITVMRDGLAWAKQTESDIEGRSKRVALLPEEVHRQLRDLKKLQSEVMAKQGQLESLVEEVTELLPQLDQAEEVPMVRSSLDSLEELSKSTTEKLAKAVRETESGLQTREKLSEQIADLDSWVLAYLHREASRSPGSELRSPTELERRVRHIEETLSEGEKQDAVCEALLMKSKDISSELSITENCQLFDKLTDLQEDIRAISNYEKANKKEVDESTQTVDLSKKKLVDIEKSLRQMSGDLSRHRFPITRESMQSLEPFKQMLLEHKSQVDLLQTWIPQEKTKELHSLISELLSKIVHLEMKVRGHERYLNQRNCMEALREKVQEQVGRTKDDSSAVEDKYKVCQTLIVQLPLIKYMSEEAGSKLQMISAELYPSQLSTERQRLKQNEESLDTLEVMLYNNLNIFEWTLLQDLDLDSEKAAAQAFLQKTQQELHILPILEPNETAIDSEYQRILSLKKTVMSRMRALEVLERKKGSRKGGGSQDLMDLKNAVLGKCDLEMANISQTKEFLRGYTVTVTQAAQFLRDIEMSVLPPQGSAGLCSDMLEKTQQALVSLQQQFQTHVEQLQNQVALHSYLSPQKLEQLQESILSQLLVRMSTLQARGHMRLECLTSCTENHKKYIKCRDEILQSVRSSEDSLSQFTCLKITCLTDCTDQQNKLQVLSEEVESLQRRLEELEEWCPEWSCRGGREASTAAVWKHVSRLRRCTQALTTRSKQRIAEWSEITNSVEKASALLEQVEAEHPDGSRLAAFNEDLLDLLQSWEQYQDRLDCEHRALSALELRTARLLGVPAHLEQAPPIPLCQQLQAMQGRYSSVKQSSTEGLKAVKMELEGREKVREELQGIKVWLEAADGLLLEMEQSSSTQELQEVHSQVCNQKALLQHITESLKMKYSDTSALVPVEIQGQLQEVTQSLQQVEAKVAETVEKSGPVYQLGAKLSEIQAGLTSVQKRLEQRSPNVTQAKLTQKCVWDELDVWHSCLAALEVDMQDLEKPEEVLILTERLVEVQQLHSHLAKQAEQRTALLSKTHSWLQEHQEMISSSQSWIAEAKSWLASPCVYTTAKCLSSHVHTLQMVLDDSAQIRTTLQGFGSVLKEMSQVCDITTLRAELAEADQQVANVQDSFTAPLSHLRHAADEVEAIESEVRRMENDVAEIKTLLLSPETFTSPREESLKAVEQRIQSMRRTVAEIQKCKPGLCLPEKAEDTLTVFTVVNQLQTLLLELEKKVPALFIQQPPTPVQAKAPSAQTSSQPHLLKSTSEEAEKEDVEQGQIKIVHVEEDVLKRCGASLLTVERSSPEQRQSWTPDSSQEPVVVVPEETEGASGQTGEQDVESSTDTTEASSPEAFSKPLGTVTTQSLSESMVNTAATVKVSKPDSGPQQRCVIS